MLSICSYNGVDPARMRTRTFIQPSPRKRNRTMTKTKFTPEQKIQVVLESNRTNIGMAELCRRHNIHPQMFQTWRYKFKDTGKAGLATMERVIR